MKKYLGLIILLVSVKMGTAQTCIEIGAQKNFLRHTQSFESVNSFSVQGALTFMSRGFPVYGGVNLQYMLVQDQLIKTNKFQQAFPGVKAGVRPLASFLIIPVQPFIEGYYEMAILKKDPVIKNIYGFGGGLEVYYTKKHAVAFYYGLENYRFNTGGQLNNHVARITLRFN